MQREHDAHIVAHAPHLGRQRPGDVGQAAHLDERRCFRGEEQHLQRFMISFGHLFAPGYAFAYYSRRAAMGADI